MIGERFFRQGNPKTQAILYVLARILDDVGEKTATERCEQDLISGYFSGFGLLLPLYASKARWCDHKKIKGIPNFGNLPLTILQNIV